MATAVTSDPGATWFQALLLDSVAEAVIATDVTGTVTYWNSAAERLYGWTAAEAVGQPVVDLTPAPQSVEKAKAIFAEVVAGRSWTGEFLVRHRDGQAFWVQVKNSPVFDADGVLQAIIGTSADITERKRSEHTVRHLSAIVESSSDAIIGETLDCTIISWNAGAERLYGYTAAEAIGQSITVLAHFEREREEVTEIIRRVASGVSVQGLETVGRHRDGTLVEVSLAVSPVFAVDGSVSGFSTIARSDAARRETERALQQQADALVMRLAEEKELSERLRELDRIKDDFVGNVSHELRTPLTGIVGYLELLKEEEFGVLTAQQLKLADAADRNGRRLLELVDNLLTVSAIEAGELHSDSLLLDLRDVMSAARLSLRPSIDARRLTTCFDVCVDQVVVRGDAGQLEQVVSNLLSNAVKFTEDGGTVVCALGVEGMHATLTVSDDGIGIPENEQRGLFTRFFRSTAATERAIAGSGLGLSIVSSIVRSHGGDILVTSASGIGTQVRVTLPLAGMR